MKFFFVAFLTLPACGGYPISSLILAPAAFACTGLLPAEPNVSFSFWRESDGTTMADAGPKDGCCSLNKSGAVFFKAPDSSCFKAEDGTTWCFAKENRNVRIDRYDNSDEPSTVLAVDVCD